MKNVSPRNVSRSIAGAVLAVLLCPAGPARATTPPGDTPLAPVGPGSVVVHTAFGGFILGYDIDQTGTEGLLCEALTLPDGTHDVAIETFDQRTGAIVKIVAQQLSSKSDFVALGIVGSHVGLVEYEHVTDLFVDNRTYFTLDPLSSNALGDRWTPALGASDIILGVARSQGVAQTAVLAFHNGAFSPFVFGTDVAANTFGQSFTLTDPDFDVNHAPVLALDSATNRAVLGTLGANPFGPPKLATVDLASGATDIFTGVGIGYVNGLAVDSSTGIACTSTEIDFRVEFYDLATKAGFTVKLPGAVSQAQSGDDVQCDPIHKLFLVGQPISSTAPSGSSLQVFNEQGGFVESINGLHLPASPALIALHPGRRTGFVLVAPDLTSLQSFSY